LVRAVEVGMTWMQTVSGMPVDLLDPKPEMILLGDIAHALARIPRFCGHTLGEWPWSVAQHSLLVEELMPAGSPPSDRLVALLHDAHEAYVGDVITPVKRAMDALPFDLRTYKLPSDVFLDIVDRLDVAIWKAFGLEPSAGTMGVVRYVDLVALAVEKELLMTPARMEWDALPALPDPMPVLRPAHPPTRVAEVFLDRFRILQAERHGLKVA